MGPVQFQFMPPGGGCAFFIIKGGRCCRMEEHTVFQLLMNTLLALWSLSPMYLLLLDAKREK